LCIKLVIEISQNSSNVNQ